MQPWILKSDQNWWKKRMIYEVLINFGQICSYLLQACGWHCQIWPKLVKSVHDMSIFDRFWSNLCGQHPQIWPMSGELSQPFLKSDRHRSNILLQSSFSWGKPVIFSPIFTDAIYLFIWFDFGGLCKIAFWTAAKYVQKIGSSFCKKCTRLNQKASSLEI